ncbi:MAG TPA: beta-ketoacyl-[acyl-carrier-protein] synthase family protein [Chthoniobacterales bacterium]|nr:beta-ketoacyl-[acyl-carrier-protein] synthase family protein [Chthoniobacterales bacterium]
MRRNRVVITGIGILAPNGIGVEDFWESILAGRSGIGPITLFDATGFKSRIAGEVKNFDPLDYIEPELKPKRMARHTQLAYAASMLALEDAGFDSDTLELPSPVPVIIGVSMNSMDVLERALEAVRDDKANRVSPITCAASLPQGPANIIADRIGAFAHAKTVSAACPSGLDAVADAAAMIRSGQAEIAIAGGSDAPITPIAMASFTAADLSSFRNGDPEKASRPFDIDRDSGVISEGAGVFVLENLDAAQARGTRPYLEIIGYARQRDRDPMNPGSGLEDSMRMALANAGRTIEDVDYISAYGPGHPVLDAIEVAVIKRVFGEEAYSVPVSSIKGVTGNALAAGGPLQLAACALTIRDRLIAPTANYESADPDCDLDFVPNRPRRSNVQCALINVRGLGGSASTMVVSRVAQG